MVNVKVLKAFLYDLITSLLTMGAVYLTVPENVEKIGFSDYLVPIIVGVAGAAVLAIRRFRLEK